MKNKIFIVTGAAGFIGYHLSMKLLNLGAKIIGIDNLNEYYDIKLKKSRLTILEKQKQFVFYKEDINNKEAVDKIFKKYKPIYVINLAAQAGVRYSIENPDVYIQSNIIGFFNILELCRKYPVKHLLFASSSSVYGANKKIPFSTTDNVDNPISLYAATKKSNELMAYAYSSLYNIPTTGLRFFTVYGPYGRPDMAYFTFTKDIIEKKAIKVFNNGNMFRDFTYIDDIVESITLLIKKIPKKDKNQVCYKIYNIGNNKPEKIDRFIEILEKNIGKRAIKINYPMQKGDVKSTFADISELIKDTSYKPKTNIEEGLKKFIEWYKEYYKIK
ncbi:MAG: NAD-dependent epimerase/dehydratase family protein [Bacilli bacterium]|nr:NAD-dependent epimerase/dehydratase family protein [Bacilli bacterium]